MLKGSDLTEATAILDGWFIKLKEEHMFKHYFSRTNPTKSTFCDKEGWFNCEGVSWSYPSSVASALVQSQAPHIFPF